MAIFTGAILSSFLISTLISIAISVVLSVVVSLLTPRPQQQQQQANQPQPPNGSFNERQEIPPLRVIFGRVKSGGDFAFLEDRAGAAYQIIVHAAHRIEGYVQHWLHDEIVTLDDDGNAVTPGHFAGKLDIHTQLGLNVETAWARAVSVFPSIWTVDHRGDGLSKVMIQFGGVAADAFSTTYPQGMPVHTAVIDGALVFDPRTNQDPNDPDTWAFSRNLALGRLFHLTHPSGGRLRLSDLNMAEWIVAADVADELVVNRDTAEEPRYWGGLSWKFRGDGQDAVSIGQKLDEAAELVVYQRGDGLIGVHAGVIGEPTIWLDDDDFLSFRYDTNQSQANTVLAVRGHFTDPRNQWAQSDAAIYGDPYTGADETQRTGTVDNPVVQSHNHIQRLQKLRYIRANAPRVSAKIQYDDATADILFSRFIGVRKPNRGLDPAILELVGGTKLSLTDMTISFDAIVVPADLYDFDASTEEGIPGGVVGLAESTGVPVPTGFTVAWLSDSAGFYGRATWDFVDNLFVYELQYQLADASEPPRSVSSNPTETVARTPPLPDVDHRFRLRTWSGGAPSGWTAWLAPGDSEGDTTPTADPSGLTVTPNALFNGYEVAWTNPSDSNFHHTELYRAFGAFAIFTDAELVYTHYGAPGSSADFADVDVGVGDGMTTYISYWARSYNGSGVASALVGPTVG